MEKNDTAPAMLRARQALSELFLEALSAAGPAATFESFEDDAIRIGHEAIASAMAAALERLDAELCLEADGAWFSVQRPGEGEPRRLEVKAVCAYSGKEARGGKVRRIGVARHVMVGAASEFMPQAVAAVGSRYDLSKVRRVHVGADGEPWCINAGAWLPNAEATPHLDPFHVNRAVLSCFPDPKAG